MTKDEIILAQQARIEQLNTTLNKFLDSHEECTDFDGFTAYIVSMDDFHDAQEEVDTKPNYLSALRAHDAALTAKHIEICKKLAAENEGLAGEVWCERCADAIEKGGVL